jgi:ATP-dependent RNA helicase DeaD
MPPPIRKLADRHMYDPVMISVTPEKLTVDKIQQAYVEVSDRDKGSKLAEILKEEDPEHAIIFCRTKIGAARLERKLSDAGLRVKALHGDMSQGQRDGVMISFKDHRVPLLVATDIAARGLDIEHVTHVINYDLPNNTEIYVHRIGRTGRVGRTGRAITLVTPKQVPEIARIEAEAKTTIGVWERPEERVEHAPRPRKKEPGREAPAGDGTAKLFVNRGRRSGLEEEDLRWALREGALIPEEAIRDIHVLDRFSFLHVDAEHGERAIEMLDGTRVKGKPIRLELARQ